MCKIISTVTLFIAKNGNHPSIYHEDNDQVKHIIKWEALLTHTHCAEQEATQKPLYHHVPLDDTDRVLVGKTNLR